jgi:hypothetical protein
MGGCHRKVVLVMFPPVAQPIALETRPPLEVPEIETPPPQEPEVADAPPLTSVTVPPATPPRRRPPTAPVPPPQPPVQVAGNVAPDAGTVAIGALSTGGNASTQSQQEARNLIASIMKRLAALPAKKADAQKNQVRQVRRFLDQAQRALDSGDAEGAKTLATKAKLLMDDVEK